MLMMSAHSTPKQITLTLNQEFWTEEINRCNTMNRDNLVETIQISTTQL